MQITIEHIQMENEIVNKVAQSGLVTIDLEDYFISGERILFDIKSWLFEELVLREKDFRENIGKHDWSQYTDKLVAITCTADAIVPTWAFMLITTQLEPYTKSIVFGNLEKLEEDNFMNQIAKLNVEDFKAQKVVIKGCSKIHVPVSVYVALTAKLRPVVKSIMYGEPCSTVPIYKKK